MQLLPIKPGQIFGRWKLETKLGHGGNGEVWKVTNLGDGSAAALKVLNKIKSIAYQRFKDETKILSEWTPTRCVVPIIDFNLPEDPELERSWYVMPLGQPLHEAMSDASTRDKVLSVAGIAEAMAMLHEREIVHRDVKPGNFLFIDGIVCLADFGLVDYPDKADITGRKQDIGPRWTMAPEVWRHELGDNAKPSDVYSLAKSLWILLTRVWQGFDGAYDPYSSVGLRCFLGRNEFLGPLDSLLVKATHHDPKLRPSMKEFATKLSEWLHLEVEFNERNRLEWEELMTRLFRLNVPTRAVWTTAEDIALVLGIIGERSNVNHMFFPDGGGLDLNSACISSYEADCVEMDAGSLVLFRPESLTFEKIGNAIDLSYFRLEVSDLQPSGAYEEQSDRYCEEKLRLGDSGEYVDRAHWDHGEYGGDPLPQGSRPVSRYFKGSFVITSKASIYNRINGRHDAYDGRHNKMSAGEFRLHMEKLADAWRRHYANEMLKQRP